MKKFTTVVTIFVSTFVHDKNLSIRSGCLITSYLRAFILLSRHPGEKGIAYVAGNVSRVLLAYFSFATTGNAIRSFQPLVERFTIKRVTDVPAYLMRYSSRVFNAGYISDNVVPYLGGFSNQRKSTGKKGGWKEEEKLESQVNLV